MKNYMITYFGACVGAVASFLGGFTFALKTLIIFMAIDYITGIIVAAVFKKSTKTNSGSLKSIAGFKGILKKVCILLAVGVALRIDILVGSSYVHNTVIFAYLINEAISIVENFGLMGMYIPEPLKKAIEILNEKEMKKWKFA